MPLHNLTRFPRLEFIGAPTPLEYLPRFSDYLGRDIFIKRDDVTPMAMGGNKLRKLEFLAADALREGADTLITAGAIQSNHVRQTAAVAAKLGLHCVALLENPIGTTAENYLTNGNRLLLDLFNTQIEMCDALTDPKSGIPYYKAEVVVLPEGMKKLRTHEIRPGMPAEIFVQTGERSAMNYFVKPLIDRMQRSMTED